MEESKVKYIKYRRLRAKGVEKHAAVRMVHGGRYSVFQKALKQWLRGKADIIGKPPVVKKALPIRKVVVEKVKAAKIRAAKRKRKGFDWYMSHPYMVKGIDKEGKPITWKHARVWALPFTTGSCYFYRTGLERTKEYREWMHERERWKEYRNDHNLSYNDLDEYKIHKEEAYDELVVVENKLRTIKQFHHCDIGKWEYDEEDPTTWYHGDTGEQRTKMKAKEDLSDYIK